MIWVGLLLLIGVLVKENNHFKTARGFYTAALVFNIINIITFSIRSFINMGSSTKETAGAGLLAWIFICPLEIFIATRIVKARDRLDVLISEGAIYKTKRKSKTNSRKKR